MGQMGFWLSCDRATRLAENYYFAIDELPIIEALPHSRTLRRFSGLI